jgi:hypothetical protein
MIFGWEHPATVDLQGVTPVRTHEIDIDKFDEHNKKVLEDTVRYASDEELAALVG